LSKSLLSDNIASNGRLIVLRGCSSSCCYCACFTIRERGVPALKNWCPLMRQQQDSHCLESWLTASNDNPHSTQTQQPQGDISTWSVPDSIATSHRMNNDNLYCGGSACCRWFDCICRLDPKLFV
jgi:hypothetical protein